MRELFLVRHGETEGESSIRFHGRNDVPLSDVGREQVSRLGPMLRERRFAAVVHSPLSRARESASILLAALASPPPVVHSIDGLAEVNFGRIEGMTRAEIEAAHPDWYRRWIAGETDGYPDGDSHAGFGARVAAAFDEVLARCPDGDVLVVAHKGVIKRGAGHLCELPADEVASLELELGSLSVVRCGTVASIASWNVVPG